MSIFNQFIKIALLLSTVILMPNVLAANDQEMDKKINTNIQEKIANNPALSAYHIDIVTDKGIVKLTGVVDSDKDAGILITETQSASGVRDINISGLKIKNQGDPLKDTVITAKVKGKLIEKELFGKINLEAMDTHVQTKDGMVILSGMVKNQERANNAIAIAKSVKGVKEVKSDLKIEE